MKNQAACGQYLQPGTQFDEGERRVTGYDTVTAVLAL